MFKKTKIIVGLCISAVAISTIVPVATVFALKNQNKLSNSNTSNQNLQKYFFDNKEFDSKVDLVNYAKTLVVENQDEQLKRDKWSIDWNNQTYYFKDIKNLYSFLNDQIQTYPVQTSMDLKNILFDANNEILNNQLDKFYLGNNNQTVKIYRGKDNSIHLSESDAKKSYLSMHDVYVFDNIYFRNKEELNSYLDKNFETKYLNQVQQNLKRINLVAPDKTRSMPIEIKNLDPSTWVNNNPSIDATYLSNFVSTYAKRSLRVENNNSSTKYSYYSEQDLSNKNMLGSIMNTFDAYSYINAKSNEGKTNYLVDLSTNDKYELFGPYYVKSGSEIQQITNPDSWQEVSADSFKFVDNALNAQLFAEFVGNIINDDDSLVDNTIQTPFHIAELQNQTQQYFQQLFNSAHNVYNNVMELYNTMKQGKRYNVFYKLPILYIKTIEELMYYKADYSLVQLTREYYESIAKLFDEKLHLFVPKSFLLSTNQKDYFSFVDLFSFNSNNLDLNYDIEQLTGIISTQYPKLFSAVKFLSVCFVIYSKFPSVLDFDLQLVNKIGDCNFEYSFDANEMNYLKTIFDMITKIDKNLVQNNFLTIIKTYEPNDQKAKSILNKYIDEINLKYYDQKIIGVNNVIKIIQDEINKFEKSQNSDFGFDKNSFFYNIPLNIVKQMINFFKKHNKIDFKYTYKTLLLYKICWVNNIINSSNSIEQLTFNVIWNLFKSKLNFLKPDWIIKNILPIPFIMLTMFLDPNFEIPDINIDKTTIKFQQFYDNVSSVLLDVLGDVKDILEILKDVFPKIEKLFDAFSTFCKAIPFVSIAITILSNIFKQEKSSYIFETEDVRYIWNGGITNSYLFGLIEDKKSSIEDMQILKPQCINKPRIKDQYYYGNKFYDELNILKKDQLYDILNNKFKTNKIKTVYSFSNQDLEPNSNEKLGFESIGDINNLQSDTLLFDIINDLKTNSSFKKYETDECYKFANGYIFESDLKSTAIAEVMKNITPTKIIQLPNTINNYIDTNNELSSYMLPGISWTPATDLRKNETNRKYIFADGNIKNDNSSSSTVSLQKQLESKFLNSFNVESKTILKKDLKNNANFTDFNTCINDLNLYVVNFANLPTKIFLNKADAFNFLIKHSNFKVYDYFIKNTTYKYKNQTFNTLNEYLNYVIEQSIQGENNEKKN